MTGDITDAVRRKYGQAAESALSNHHDGVRAVAEAFGYSPAELRSIPAEANLGLSCGNPTAMAGLRPGETVLDLGCGGGLDVFLAAQRVGPAGKAIGVDMTEAMLQRARRNALAGPDGQPYANVEFHLATIDRLPFEDASVDCIVSNCVINLAVDKPAVFREMFRVLKPGGRAAISDIALKQALPEELATDISAFVGCIAGAIPLEEYRHGLLQAGFLHVEIVDSQADLNAYAKVENQAACCSPAAQSAADGLPLADAGCCGPADAASDPALHQRLAELLGRYNVNDYAASVKIFAARPGLD